MSKTGHHTIMGVATALWAGLLLNLILPFPEPWDKVLLYFAIGLAFIHALELLMFRGLLGAGGNSKLTDSLYIMIGGAFHASWLAAQRARQSQV